MREISSDFACSAEFNKIFATSCLTHEAQENFRIAIFLIKHFLFFIKEAEQSIPERNCM